VTVPEGYSHANNLNFNVAYEPGQDTSFKVDITVDSSATDLEYVGVDATNASTDDHVIMGTAGGDSIDASARADGVLIQGGDGDDVIIGSDYGDTIYTGGGNNEVWDGAGNDIVVGGIDGDIFHVGAGDNILTGGGGSDTYIFTADSLSGSNTIRDFHVGHDLDADVLDIGSLLTGFDPAVRSIQDLFDKGFLSFHDIKVGTDGRCEVILGIDRDGAEATDYGSEKLATIHMDNVVFTDPGASLPDLAQELVNQLMAGNQIKFD
jgi:Ca2+-binding RTX toxin-like protein